jgi:hypothetical protein
LSARRFVIRTLLRWLRSRPRSSLTPSPNGIPRATNKTLPKSRRLRPRTPSACPGRVIITVTGMRPNSVRRLMPLRGRNPSSSFATDEPPMNAQLVAQPCRPATSCGAPDAGRARPSLEKSRVRLATRRSVRSAAGTIEEAVPLMQLCACHDPRWLALLRARWAMSRNVK